MSRLTSKSVHLYLSFIAVVYLATFIQPVLSQGATSEFPYVVSNESFSAYVGDVGFAISNNAQNIFTCLSYGDCFIWRRDVDQEIHFSGSDGIGAYWSIDNSRLLTIDSDNICPSDTNQYKTILFETNQGTISHPCSPAKPIVENWSPLQSHKLYISPLLDSDTFQLSSFSFPSTFSPTDINHYWGYGETFWDLNTSLPVGEISLKVQSNLQNQITQSRLRICTLDVNDCQVLLDTLIVAPVDVFDYKLYKKWILWGGHLSSTGQALSIENRPSEIANTILYLTNFHTGVTRELFRFSSLGQTNTYVRKFAWSPNGRTIGLAISEVDDLSLLPTFPPEGTPIPTPTFPPGVVLLHLEWPS